jgi:phosphoglycolate phosphatase-like HAD superfamily hydrolase
VEPVECALVGDGPADHQVARAAGVRMIAVTWGLLSSAKALALRPDALLDSMQDLVSLLTQPGKAHIANRS